MNVIKKLFNFIIGRKYSREVLRYASELEKHLMLFQTVKYDSYYDSRIAKLKDIGKYNDMLLMFSNLTEQIASHNRLIKELEKEFDENLASNSYENIINNIEEYGIDDLKKINQTALKINDFTIPNTFSKKKKYLQYMKDIGEIVRDYDAIKYQHALIDEYYNIDFSFGDYYIDERKAKELLKPINEKIASIESYGNKYYAIPKLDKRLIENHNENFIKRHLSDVLFENINGKCLDSDQRRAILCNPRSNLVIAGAGAGKTLTICGKVKYLLENKECTSDEILLLSYSNASANDLMEKVSRINPELKVKTFHALGLEILNNHNQYKKAIEQQFDAYIRRFFTEKVPNDTEMLNDVLTFYGIYLYDNTSFKKKYKNEGEKFEDLKKSDFKTLKDKLKQTRTKENSYETIQSECVKSYEELVLANFLFINGVKYEYEHAYEIKTSTLEKRQYTPDFYLPEYGIYIEHYGIDKNGRTPQYTSEEECNYLKSIEWKRNIHKEHNTVCIETYSYEFNDETIFKNLKKRLIEKGVKLKPLSEKDIQDAFNNIFMGQDFRSLINLFSSFISLYKAQYYDDSVFGRMEGMSFTTPYGQKRAKLFLKICKNAYTYYIDEVRKQDKIDFDDMILQAILALDTEPNFKYKYIIVDEFQDISKSRALFLQRLIKHGDSKLFAVGDDWQAIYRFAGCDLTIFLHFEKYFEDVKKNYITSTHRNSKELQNIVEPFITANPEQFIKHIHSEISQKEPVRIIYHKGNKMAAFTEALNQICKENDKAKVLVLGRNKHDVDCMISKEIQVVDYEKIIHSRFSEMEITYKTVHQSKGLESEYVILISGEDAKNGFPNQMEDDLLLQLVLGENSKFEFAEERRLFYVALTRTRSIVYILANKNRSSEFVKEIETRAKVENPELLSEDEADDYLCPWCKSGRLVVRTSENGDSFYGCTNYPYCKYTINDFKAVRTNNHCPSCGDFLVVRNGRYGKFIACHGYPYCKHTRQLN